METLNIDNLEAYVQKVVVPGLKRIDQDANMKGKQHHVEQDYFGELYEKKIEQCELIKPHAEAETFPRKLFSDLSPHRRKDEAQWLEKNYEPFTIPVWIDFMNSIKRGLNGNNYSIKWPDMPNEYSDESKTLEYYCKYEIPKHYSIETWFKNNFFDNKLKDANGLVAVLPKDNFTRVNEETGEYIIDPDVMIEPYPEFYNSKQVIYYDDEVSLVIAPEKSVVSYGGQEKREGWILYLYTKDSIYKIIQVGKKVNYEFEMHDWFPHGWGSLPVWRVKGLPKITHGEVYYQSPYLYATGALNTVLRNKMMLEMSTANSAFPYRIMIADECDFEGDDGAACFHGKVILNGDEVTCPGCNGTGLKDKPSAGGTLLVNEAEVEGTNSLDRIRFVAPDRQILDFLSEKCETEELRARNILHLKTTTDQAKGDATATGKLIDQGSMYAFVMPILHEGFDVFEGVLDAITFFRYGNTVDSPTVMRPTDIDFKTSNDYLTMYKEALAAGAPPSVVLRFMEKYIKSLFYSSKKEQDIWKLVLSVDSLSAYSNDEVRQLKGSKMVANWQAVLHVGIFNFIDELIREDESFLEKPIEDQKAALIEKAKNHAAEISQTGANQDLITSVAGA